MLVLIEEKLRNWWNSNPFGSCLTRPLVWCRSLKDLSIVLRFLMVKGKDSYPSNTNGMFVWATTFRLLAQKLPFWLLASSYWLFAIGFHIRLLASQHTKSPKNSERSFSAFSLFSRKLVFQLWICPWSSPAPLGGTRQRPAGHAVLHRPACPWQMPSRIMWPLLPVDWCRA